jgi:phospholipase C
MNPMTRIRTSFSLNIPLALLCLALLPLAASRPIPRSNATPVARLTRGAVSETLGRDGGGRRAGEGGAEFRERGPRRSWTQRSTVAARSRSSGPPPQSAVRPAASRPASPGEVPPAIRLLRRRIRHVFVVYQENRTFDNYFGTYPGADNLATESARRHGFRQYDPIGKQWIEPFLIRAADTADPGHSRPTLLARVHGGRMDAFVKAEEFERLAAGQSPDAARAGGLLTMAYVDCNTVPFLWYYAHRFTLYDHIFQGMYGPSTPGNIDLIAAQTGQTQLARHPDEREAPSGLGEPVFGDLEPAFGPYHAGAPASHQLDQKYATVLLTLEGRNADDLQFDTDDINEDIGELARLRHAAVPWGWYQEGFGDGVGNDHPAYIPHHNAPQYFGYIRWNAPLWSGVHDLSAFFDVLRAGGLPERSVSFIKGGLRNPFGWLPADANPAIRKHFVGDDDHAGYSDSQLSESLVATVVNAVARSPYWSSSAIIVIWDDAGGWYDHVPPPSFERCPDGHPCGDGPRIPFLLISPYVRAGQVIAQPGDHASFAKFLDALFGLPPLATLPDEKPYMPEGPRDTNARIGDLTAGFDPARLAGTVAPVPASDAEIDDRIVNNFPPAMSCRDTGVAPVALGGGAAPDGFHPLISARPKKKPPATKP